MEILEEAFIRHRLKSVERRVADLARALDWADGLPQFSAAELVPEISGDEAAVLAARRDFSRYAGQVQTAAVRALSLKRAIAVGEVNWGGDSSRIDERLDAGLLAELAHHAFKPLAVGGVTATRAYLRERDGQPVMEWLGGYLEPIWAEDSIGTDLIGLWQITASNSSKAGEQYNIRKYDLVAATVSYWDRRRTPTEVGGPADAVDEGDAAYLPNVAFWNLDQSGLPAGEIQQAMPTFVGEASLQFTIKRVSDTQGKSLLWLAGAWEQPQYVGASTVLVNATPEGKVGRVEPGDMTQLFLEHDRTLERLRGDLSLPFSFLGGGQFPSGEAISEANVPFFANARKYASVLGANLTATLADYAGLLGISDPPPVEVGISREALRRVVSEQVRQDYAAGIVPLEAAAREVSAYYPTWSSDELEAWLEGQREGAGGGRSL